MTDAPGIAADLRQHIALCQEILALVERESIALSQPAAAPDPALRETRKSLLPRLDASLATLKRHRAAWQKLTPADRAAHAEIPPLLRSAQDLIMRIVVLDRENEQVWLRRGLVPPKHLPPARRQQPKAVAELYRRNQKS